MRVNFFLKGVALAGASLWVLGVGVGLAQEPIVLRAHHFLAPSSTFQAHVLEPWKQRVEEDSQGRLVVEIYPLMQLGGKAPQLYDQVRNGVVDLVWVLQGYTAGRFPKTEVFELPFMVTQAASTSLALQAFYERHLRDEYEDVHPIFFHVHARGSFHMRKDDILTLGDVKGLKIRAPSRLTSALIKELGGVPIGVAVPEVPPSLASGVLDGAMLPWQVTLPLRSSELVGTHTEFKGRHGLYTATFIFAMNKARYESLPAELQTVIDANSGLDTAGWVGAIYDRDEVPGRARAVELGNRINVIESEAEIERWRQKLLPVRELWVADMNARGFDGEALLSDAIDLIEFYDRELGFIE